jgi:agmatinase
MTKQEKIDSFDPNSVGDTTAGMFGLPFTLEECETIMIPVPWEVTVSYGGGTVYGPQAIYDASFQVDLYDPNKKDAWKLGIGMIELPHDLQKKSEKYRLVAEGLIGLLANGDDVSGSSEYTDINHACEEMNSWVKETALRYLKQNKTVGLIGGDHSTPLGMMKALAEHHGKFGILQIDAHADLRDAYEGFHYSHASIMFNALKIEQVEKLVQVGIRDYCEEELNVINGSNGRVKTFFDRDLKHASYAGETWQQACDRIVATLPNNIYLSFDIDGLDPKLCPNTGTPVAGGFEAEQVLYLIEQVVKSGKKIIAFDINEVTPGADEWDANVAARLLYRIANLVMHSQGK